MLAATSIGHIAADAVTPWRLCAAETWYWLAKPEALARMVLRGEIARGLNGVSARLRPFDYI
jgi:hypothetical protein